jgi:hypothetical protein
MFQSNLKAKKYMRLREVFISLVGFFKCTIDDNTFMCAGVEQILQNENGEDVADLYLFDVMNLTGKKHLGEIILVVFNQVGDKLLFLYKKDKYQVISTSDNLITIRKDGIDYFIERIEMPV